MDLKHLKTFVAIAEIGSFSKAAAQEGMTQSALSRQISLLEIEFSQRLFMRTGRGVVVTEAGASLLRNAKAMLELAENSRHELSDLASSPGGTVTIGLSPRVGRILSAPLVQQFRGSFPRARISLFEGTSHHLREALILGKIDLAVMFDPFPSPALHCEPLCKEEMVLVASLDGARIPDKVTVSELGKWPLIIASGSNTIRQLVDSAVDAQRIALNIIAEVDSVHGMLTLASASVGCAVVPRSAIGSKMRTRLQIAEIDAPTISSTLVLAMPRAGATTRLVSGAAQLIRQLDFLALSSAHDG